MSSPLPLRNNCCSYLKPFIVFLQSNKQFRRGGCNGRSSDNVTRSSKRPFQKLEKICSLVMALLFITFNILYWPWLLSDDDFDYAKFEVILYALFSCLIVPQ